MQNQVPPYLNRYCHAHDPLFFLCISDVVISSSVVLANRIGLSISLVFLDWSSMLVAGSPVLYIAPQLGFHLLDVAPPTMLFGPTGLVLC